MTKKFKNKESEKDTKDVKVELTESPGVEEIDSKSEKKDKEYTPVPHGVGGQFVDIGGGVKVPASEIAD